MPPGARPLFEPAILPLIGVDPLERPAPGKPGPIPALLSRSAEATGKLLIYIPGGLLGAPLSGRHDYNALAEGLNGVGVSLLAVHLAVAQRPIYLPFETCIGDIRNVLHWAAAEGFDQVSLAGNGLGAARIGHWASRNDAEPVHSLILLSAFESPYLAIQRCGDPAQRRELDRLLDTCREHVAEGRAQEVVELPLPDGRRLLSAASLIAHFGRPDEAPTTLVRNAGAIRAPVCLIHGQNDPVAPAAGVSAVFESLPGGADKRLIWIPGGDHQLLATPSTVAPTVAAICSWLAR